MSSVWVTGKGFLRQSLPWKSFILTSISPRSFRSSGLRTRLLQSILEDKAALYLGNRSASTRRTIVTIPKFAKKKKKSPKEETRTSFTFPLLHQDVMNVISDEITSARFLENDSDEYSNNESSTNVMGKFKCNNDACSRDGWNSKMVAILIKGYPRNGYNAVVFNQRCRSCNHLGTLTLDKKSYIDRVAYRLKKWAGVPVEQPPYSEKEGLPHESSLCEGCKRNLCQQKHNWAHR
jgi:hypothetical protein